MMPSLLILPVYAENKWRVVRVRIDYDAGEANVLWDDPRGKDNLPSDLANRMKRVLGVAVQDLMRAQLDRDDVQFRAEQLNIYERPRMLDLRSHSSGPIVVKNMSIYLERSDMLTTELYRNERLYELPEAVVELGQPAVARSSQSNFAWASRLVRPFLGGAQQPAPAAEAQRSARPDIREIRKAQRVLLLDRQLAPLDTFSPSSLQFSRVRAHATLLAAFKGAYNATYLKDDAEIVSEEHWEVAFHFTVLLLQSKQLEVEKQNYTLDVLEAASEHLKEVCETSRPPIGYIY